MIVVGDDPASAVYVRNKIRACAEIGIQSFRYDFPSDVAPQTILQLIRQLNERSDVKSGRQVRESMGSRWRTTSPAIPPQYS